MDLIVLILQTLVGIHDAKLYTTAYDLALIARYAMNNNKFREIVKTVNYTIPSSSFYPQDDRTFHNSNLLLEPSETNYYYEYATGIKTGFTDPAGDCLVASAKKDNVEFIVVCLKSGNLENGLREKFIDSKTLFDFAFANYITYYKNLQEGNIQNEVEITPESTINVPETPAPELLDHNISNSKDLNTNYDFFRNIIKVIAVMAIIISMKLLLFGKK